MENYDADSSNVSAEQASPQTSSEVLVLTQTTLAGNEEPLSKKERRKMRRAESKAERKEDWANMSRREKAGCIFWYGVIFLVILAISICGTLGILEYYEIIYISYVEDILIDMGLAEEVYIGTSYGLFSDYEHIVFYDRRNCYGYVDNIILVDNQASDGYIAVVLESINGTIAGETGGPNDYAVQVEPMEYEELIALCEELCEFECVRSAEPNDVFGIVLN